MIPRIVHQIWFGPPMPEQCRRWVDKVRETFTAEGWQHILWTLDDLRVIDGGRTTLGDIELITSALICRAPTYCEMSDIARFEILYGMGGVYFDCDVALTAGVDQIMMHAVGGSGIIGHKDDLVSTFWMYSRKGGSFMKRCLKAICNGVPNPTLVYDSAYCGPHMLKRVYEESSQDTRPWRIPGEVCYSKKHGEIGCHHNRCDWRTTKVLRHEWTNEWSDGCTCDSSEAQ